MDTLPSDTDCFLSSVDVHTHYGYQSLLGEAVAVVCSPRYGINKWLRLTPAGMNIVGEGTFRGCHEHVSRSRLFAQAVGVVYNQREVTLIDLRGDACVSGPASSSPPVESGAAAQPTRRWSKRTPSAPDQLSDARPAPHPPSAVLPAPRWPNKTRSASDLPSEAHSTRWSKKTPSAPDQPLEASYASNPPSAMQEAELGPLSPTHSALNSAPVETGGALAARPASDCPHSPESGGGSYSTTGDTIGARPGPDQTRGRAGTDAR